MTSKLRYPLVYGAPAGVAIICAILLGLTLAERDGFFTSEYLGYLVMLVALTLVFVGVKRYRDVELGGIIRFWPALGMGLAIAFVASLFYVVAWEVYLAATDYRFMDEYLAQVADGHRAAGLSEAAVAREMAQYEWMREGYHNPLIRIPITFLEIMVPPGLLVALVSALLLRNPRLLPAARRAPQ